LSAVSSLSNQNFKIIIHQFCHAPPAQQVGNSHYTTSSPFECISDSEIFCKSSKLVAKYRTYLAIPPQPMRGIFPCPKQEMQMRLQRNPHKKALQRYLSQEYRNLHSHYEEEIVRLTLPQEATERTKLGKRENKQKTKNTHWYEQKCQSHTCSGTINSSMYDSDLTITTSPLTSSAPYSG
jgi:hypothetical protein